MSYQCVFCKNKLEIVQHVLILCPLVWKVWTGFVTVVGDSMGCA